MAALRKSIFRHVFVPHSAAQLPFYRGISSKLFVKGTFEEKLIVRPPSGNQESAGITFSTTKEELADAFSQFGQVTEAKIIMDKGSNRSKGYGYVTFNTEDEAQKALMSMNGKLLDGRAIFVDNVRPSR